MTDSQALSFGLAAVRYDTHRPGYAAEAMVWALGEKPLRVADLGAGTGILSRIVRDLGHEVIAVEPDDSMRARLVEVSPGITAMAGRAEAIPLPDNAVDAVIAGQAYHWFDPARAHDEIARVLAPNGTFTAVWNDADLSATWTKRLVEILDGPDAVVQTREVGDFGPLFGPVVLAEFRHEKWFTPDDLVAMTTTRSHYHLASEQARHDLVQAVRDLTTTGELAGRESFPLPIITRAYRAHLE